MFCLARGLLHICQQPFHTTHSQCTSPHLPLYTHPAQWLGSPQPCPVFPCFYFSSPAGTCHAGRSGFSTFCWIWVPRARILCSVHTQPVLVSVYLCEGLQMESLPGLGALSMDHTWDQGAGRSSAWDPGKRERECECVCVCVCLGWGNPGGVGVQVLVLRHPYRASPDADFRRGFLPPPTTAWDPGLSLKIGTSPASCRAQAESQMPGDSCRLGVRTGPFLQSPRIPQSCLKLPGCCVLTRAIAPPG